MFGNKKARIAAKDEALAQHNDEVDKAHKLVTATTKKYRASGTVTKAEKKAYNDAQVLIRDQRQISDEISRKYWSAWDA